MKGQIKRLIRDRGFGFVSAENGKEVFFHRSAMGDVDFESLDEGTDVEFELEQGPKGLRAANLRIVTP